MPGQQKLSKGLAKRTSNTHLKDARARRWKAGQERKKQRQEANHVAFERNQRLRAQGLPTPWEQAKERANNGRQ